MTTLGQRIKELRQQAGITQRELKEYLGYMTERSVQKIEANVTAIDHNMLISLANYFNVSADYLLGRSDDPTPPTKIKNK